MKKHLINLYKFIFFKNPKRPYLLWWQSCFVYLSWLFPLIAIFFLMDINYTGNYREKKIIAVILAIIALPVVLTYLKNYEVKLRYLMKYGIESVGIIKSVSNISSVTDYIFRNKAYRYEYSYICPDSGLELLSHVSENKLIEKYYPNIKVGDRIKILYWKENNKFFIWDFETMYFKINKNYKVRK